MLYVWLLILVLLNAVWLVLVLFGLPGNWLMVFSTATPPTTEFSRNMLVAVKRQTHKRRRLQTYHRQARTC